VIRSDNQHRHIRRIGRSAGRVLSTVARNVGTEPREVQS